MFELMNSPAMYAISGIVVGFIAIVCVIFMIRAYKAGVAMGLDTQKMKRAISASATFAVLPSIGILLGVIALAGSLGTPLPWLRLSVIGALHYETQVAEAAAEQVGIELSATEMTPTAFTTIAFLMSFCICWGMILSVILTKRYSMKLLAEPSEKPSTEKEKSEDAPEEAPKKKKFSILAFGDTAMTAMFIGLVSAYIASYIGAGVHDCDFIQLAVAGVGALSMAGFMWLREKKNIAWVDNFSIAGSMIIAMASAVLFKTFM